MIENVDNVLYLQDSHISNNINAENMDSLIPPRRSDSSLWTLYNEGIHVRVRLCLAHMGFYGILQCGPIKYFDNHLLTAMVERWHRETHTFHLSVGEATITLQDVAMIWGLNIDGIPITGVDTAYDKNELQQRCLYLLGFMPEANKIKGGHLSLGAIRKHCFDHMIHDDSTDEDVAKYSRCVALLIIGGCMFPDSESAAVKLMYLPFIQDIDRVNTYSWGSAVLAYLYRELCNTAMELKKDLCGPLQILQIWVWSRITLLSPNRLQLSHMTSEHAADVLQGLPFPPYGAQWKRGFSWVHTVRHSVRTMRDMLDRMVDGQFKWTVYDMESPEVTRFLEGNRNLLCRSACPLINFDIVEMHRPERCLRQFGMRQGIPPPATNYDKFHKLTRQGRPNYDWAAFHKHFVDMWSDRYNFVINGEFIIPGTPDTSMEYISWYRRISRIFVSPTVVPMAMAGYHPIDGSYRQFFEQQYQQRGYASMSQPPTWIQNEGQAETSTTNNSRCTQNYGDPRRSTTNTTLYTPPVVSSFGLYDHDHFHTPYVGSFTQHLQSYCRPFMHDIRPQLNISPTPFQEYSQIPITETTVSMVAPSTTPTQPQTEGHEEEMYGRGRRVIVRSNSGTGSH